MEIPIKISGVFSIKYFQVGRDCVIYSNYERKNVLSKNSIHSKTFLQKEKRQKEFLKLSMPVEVCHY